MPTISVIVPVYKVEAYLDRCVESILTQTFADFELILVDDGSPDNCGAVCDAWATKDSRVKVIHQQNGGLSAARNAGIDLAQGEWLAFVDSDDYIHPQMLEALFLTVKQNDVPVSICGYQITHGEPLPQILCLDGQVWKVEDYYLQHNVNATVAWGKLYHRDCFQTIRYPVGKIHEDEFITYRILFEQNAVAVVEGQLYGYFQNDTGIMGSPWSPKRLDALEALYQQFIFFIESGRFTIAQYRMYGFVGNLSSQLEKINSVTDHNVRSESIRRCKALSRKMLREYRRHFQYSLLDFQTLYEFVYPKTAVRLLCKARKLGSTVKKLLIRN